MQAVVYSGVLPPSKVSPFGFRPCAGLRLHLLRQFQTFWPLVLVWKASAAIVLAALCRLGGAVFSWVAPVFKSGRFLLAFGSSSRPAYGGRLIWAIRYHRHIWEIACLF